MTAPLRKPYKGPRRKLVISFDLERRLVGYSYRHVHPTMRFGWPLNVLSSVLDPGVGPRIKGVTR